MCAPLRASCNLHWIQIHKVHFRRCQQYARVTFAWLPVWHVCCLNEAKAEILVAIVTNKQTRKAQPGATAAVTAPRRRFVALGTIASSATPAALLHALRELRPQCEVRLQPTTRAGHYRVELRSDDGARVESSSRHASIEPWLRIKSALMAAFPADKPNAVTAWDP